MFAKAASLVVLLLVSPALVSAADEETTTTTTTSTTTTFSSSQVNQFNAWLKQHGKSYDFDFDFDDAYYQERLKIFVENAETVRRHNRAFDLGYTSFAMTLMDSPFADTTDEEFLSTMVMESQNCSATTHPSSGKLFNKNDDDTIHLPEFVDWRTRGVMTPIKNQKHCGSCWTFSTTGTLESHICLNDKTLDCTQWTGLAEQQLVDCAGAFDNHGCNGGLPSHAFEYIKYSPQGIWAEESYPYRANDDETCQVDNDSRPSSPGYIVAEVFNITSQDEDDLVTAIAEIGPVSVAYQVTPDFRFYSHGVYDSFNATTNQTMCASDSQSVNHAVVAVGYGVTEKTDETPSIPYYIIRNSWSTSFGMEGHFWILRGQNLCGISDCASFPIVPTADGGVSYYHNDPTPTNNKYHQKENAKAATSTTAHAPPTEVSLSSLLRKKT